MTVMRIALLVLAPSIVSAQSPSARILPAAPRPGAIVRVVVAGAGNASAISGTLAGEALHFERTGSSWTALGGVPTDAEGRVTAHVIVARPTAPDSLSASVMMPRIVKPKAEPLAVDSSFSKPMDSETAARVDRENAM